MALRVHHANNVKKIVIGSRTSKLATIQAQIFEKKLLEQFPDIITEIRTFKSEGDIKINESLSKIGGKGLFIKDLEKRIVSGEIDVAVHSMKDVPADMDQNFTIIAVLERNDPRDIIISKDNSVTDIANFKRGSRIGTSAPRRKGQIMSMRPDISIECLRGNVITRIEKLQKSTLDAIILSAAGLNRLSLDIDFSYIPIQKMIPAAGQGAIGIQISTTREDLLFLKSLNHYDASICVDVERNFVRSMYGDCTTPIGAHATIKENLIKFKCIYIDDSYEKYSMEESFYADQYKEKTSDMATYIKNQAKWKP